MEHIHIRPATSEDIPQILVFIQELADYENLSHEVVATQELLQLWLFEKEKAQVVIAEEAGQPVGFALYFHNFSTFLGRAGIYLEDLYVRPEKRGRGYGKALLAYLAKLTLTLGCGRLEWACLDWNKPSIDFYLSLHARPMEDWTTYRLTGETLEALGNQAE